MKREKRQDSSFETHNIQKKKKRNQFLTRLVILTAVSSLLVGCGISKKKESSDTNTQSDFAKDLEEVIKNHEDDKVKAVEEYLKETAENEDEDAQGKQIVEESIEVDKENESCTYTDEDGVVHLIDLSEDDDKLDDGGVDDVTVNPDEELPANQSILLFGLDSADSEKAKDYRSVLDLETDKSKIEMDDDATVEDYATKLSDKSMALIETHGIVLNSSYNGYSNHPMIVLREEVTDSNKEAYADDLENKRIMIFTTMDTSKEEPTLVDYYAIFPDFFEYHYRNDKLSGSYIHLGSCMGLGKSDAFDSAFADAFLSCGAGAVTAYVNTVFTYYDLNLEKVVIQSLQEGENLGHAVAYAQSIYGQDDKEYAERMGWMDSEKVIRKLKDDGIAKMYIFGSEDWSLKNQSGKNEEEDAGETTVVDHPLYKKLTERWKKEDYLPNTGDYYGFAPESRGVLVDLTHDGLPEVLTFNKSSDGSSYELWVYQIEKEENEPLSVLYHSEYGSAHVNMRDVYLYEHADEWYLVEDMDTVYGGYAEKYYHVFSLDEDGEQLEYDEADLDFTDYEKGLVSEDEFNREKEEFSRNRDIYIKNSFMLLTYHIDVANTIPYYRD